MYYGVSMKWLAILLVFILHAPLSAKALKPTFRALIACDMTSKDIRLGSRSDMDRMKKSCLAIAQQLGLTPKITTLQGKYFTVKKVSKWLDSIPSRSGDIVLFYYSGHGGRYSSVKDPWPFLIFPLRKNPRKAKALMGGSIYQYLRKKQARLSVIIFDSCNNSFQRKDGEFLSDELILPTLTPSSPLPGLKNLFLHTKGIITSCAAKPGETAVTTVRGKITGGIFTTGFLYSVKYFAMQPNANWNDVFSGASAYCARYYQGRQHPIYTIETVPKK